MTNLQFYILWIALSSCFYTAVTQDYFDANDGADQDADDDQHGVEQLRIEEPTTASRRRNDHDLTTTKAGPTSIRFDCLRFEEFITTCTNQAKAVYNKTQNTPPYAADLKYWCRSIKILSQCGADWNENCKESSQRVHPESVKGHQSVVQSVCKDEAYLERYKWNTYCIPQIAEEWDQCYIRFKAQTDALKNSNNEWTHYDTHFQLCCVRAQFRRCTLHSLTKACSEAETIVLQKFSVIVSEGEVFQNCEIGVVYEKCPGGDPRPGGTVLLGQHSLHGHSGAGRPSPTLVAVAGAALAWLALRCAGASSVPNVPSIVRDVVTDELSK